MRLQSLLGVLLLLTGCQGTQENQTDKKPNDIASTKQSDENKRTLSNMKGWELRSWNEDGRWYFSFLAGTNRLKSADEVLSGKMDLDSLKLKLEQLKEGEMIFWGSPRIDGFINLMPPKHISQEIRAHCVKLNLKI
ncbi:MAG: hypothetical protein HY606_03865 [Planctomycetes bacterium]|nr:hypothetical protein [Planctomycetota bacterium]